MTVYVSLQYWICLRSFIFMKNGMHEPFSAHLSLTGFRVEGFKHFYLGFKHIYRDKIKGMTVSKGRDWC